MKTRRSSQGFTLLEILLVVAAIIILAGVIILATNPTKRFGEERDDQRRADVSAVLDAVYQYAVDHNGSLPSAVPSSASCAATAMNEICKTEDTCTSLVDLSVLTASEKYLSAFPADPTGSSMHGTGYFIAKSTEGRVTVCAPSTEGSVMISVTR